MKIYIKDDEVQFVFKICLTDGVKNVNADEIIEKMLSLSEKFHIAERCPIGKNEICDILKKFEDKNTICRYNMWGEVVFECRPYNKNLQRGLLQLFISFEKDDKKNHVSDVSLRFFIGYIDYVILEIVYDPTTDEYKPKEYAF